jgi:hypothetical protein
MKSNPVGTGLFYADRQPDRRTDRHDEGNSRFSQFCERAYKRFKDIKMLSLYIYIYMMVEYVIMIYAIHRPLISISFNLYIHSS